MKFAGELIRSYMEADSWSNKHLSEEVGVGSTIISKTINSFCISDKLALKIAKVLRMSRQDKNKLIKQYHRDGMKRDIAFLNYKYFDVLKEKEIIISEETNNLSEEDRRMIYLEIIQKKQRKEEENEEIIEEIKKKNYSNKKGEI